MCSARRRGFNTCSSCEEQLGDHWHATERFCFNTCSSCEEQRHLLFRRTSSTGFNTCSSCEEQPAGLDAHNEGTEVSIHAPLARSNDFVGGGFFRIFRFNTCSSCEEQRFRVPAGCAIDSFNTCSSCEEQPVCGGVGRDSDDSVSIHAPLARSNWKTRTRRRLRSRCFNTCYSCEEQPVALGHMDAYKVSIHAPLARSNLHIVVETGDPRNGFNTCSSCEEQRSRAVTVSSSCLFQYMLLLRGATRGNLQMKGDIMFQYMLLLRGATHIRLCRIRAEPVSIHAPLARSNISASFSAPGGAGFNTCSSCEEQHGEFICVFALQCFNTCSSCEEQLRGPRDGRLRGVSIHAPLARSNCTMQI